MRTTAASKIKTLISPSRNALTEVFWLLSPPGSLAMGRCCVGVSQSREHPFAFRYWSQRQLLETVRLDFLIAKACLGGIYNWLGIDIRNIEYSI